MTEERYDWLIAVILPLTLMLAGALTLAWSIADTAGPAPAGVTGAWSTGTSAAADAGAERARYARDVIACQREYSLPATACAEVLG